MCGVIGYKPGPVVVEDEVRDAFAALFRESSIRGLHAYGIAQPDQYGIIDVTKSLRTDDIPDTFDPNRKMIAHCRYSLSGDWEVLDNNQPILVRSPHPMALAFNGVISMGTKEEFEAQFGVECETYNDGEIFLRRLIKGQSVTDFLAELKGSFAGVWLLGDRLFAGRNARRPLWKCWHLNAVWYASTADIFKRAGFYSHKPVPVAEGWEEA